MHEEAKRPAAADAAPSPYNATLEFAAGVTLADVIEHVDPVIDIPDLRDRVLEVTERVIAACDKVGRIFHVYDRQGALCFAQVTAWHLDAEDVRHAHIKLGSGSDHLEASLELTRKTLVGIDGTIRLTTITKVTSKSFRRRSDTELMVATEPLEDDGDSLFPQGSHRDDPYA